MSSGFISVMLYNKFRLFWLRANKFSGSNKLMLLNVISEQITKAGKSLIHLFLRKAPKVGVVSKVEAITKPEIIKKN